MLLAEKSPGELQRARRGKEGIASPLQRAGGTQSTLQPWVSPPCPARGHARPAGRGLRRARGWGGYRSALHYCTKHLGTRWLVTVLYNVGKQPTERAGAGAAGSSRAGRRWGCAPRSMGWLWMGRAGVSCSLLSCTSTMNRQGRQSLCCRNQYRSRSGLGAPPCAPQEPAPERLSLSYSSCLLLAIVLLSSTLSRTVQQHGVASDSAEAGELANPDSLAPLGDRGNKRERPLGEDPGFILT